MSQVENLRQQLVDQQARLIARIDAVEAAIRSTAADQRRDFVTVGEVIGDEISNIRQSLEGGLDGRLGALGDAISEGMQNMQFELVNGLSDVQTAVSDVQTAVSEVGQALSTDGTHSFASQLIHEFQWHEDLTFAHTLLARLEQIDSSVQSLTL